MSLRACATYLLILLTLTGCKRRMNKDTYEALPDYPAISPSGKYVLQVSIVQQKALPYYQFAILANKAEHEVLFQSPDKFAARHTTWFLWDQDDRVWVYSGDVGVFYWEYVSLSGEWSKGTYSDARKKHIEPPSLFKKRRPRFFE